MKVLKLNALDTEGLGILSANLQDAVVQISDMSFLSGQQQFVMVLNRFDWADALEPGRQGASYKRHRTGVQIGQVLSAQQQNIDLGNEDVFISLLAIEFEETEAPSGTLKLVFSGDGVLKLNVECIEVRMSDMGESWETKNLPNHDDTAS